MRLVSILLIVASQLPLQAFASTLAICTTAIKRELVQIQGEGNQVRIIVTKPGSLTTNISAVRSVKGSAQGSNLEIQYTGVNGFVNLSCNSLPAGLIRINGVADYLACNAGTDPRAIKICSNHWIARH